MHETPSPDAAVHSWRATLAATIDRHLRVQDPGHRALKTAARAAVVIPSVFAFSDNVIASPQATIFSAFGSFSILVLANFDGPPRTRLVAYVSLATLALPLIALGTVCSTSVAAGVAATVVVGFVILFSGLINRYFAAGTFAALLCFIISVNIAAPASAIPDRFEGWGLAAAAGITAAMLVWPPRARQALKPAIARAVKAIADLLQAELDAEDSLDEQIAQANRAVGNMRERFTATPYRPTGTTTAAGALAFLVDELDWLRSIVVRHAEPGRDLCPGENCEILAATISVLRASAARLEGGDERLDLERVAAARDAGVEALARNVGNLPPGHDDAALAATLEPSFRAIRLSYGASEVGTRAMLATGALPPGAEGQMPKPSGLVGAAQVLVEQARTGSVWFQNSIRGAAGLAIAVYVAQRASVQHAFWVVLGTLSVLRSNALGTGATIVQAVAGTAVGIVAGGLLVAAIGADHGLLWAVLPLAILLAAYAPAAISFPAGQAAFTVVLVVLFNIIQPTGWKVGIVRIEDVAIGFAISLGVGLLFWPHGATAALRENAAEAYATSADYLDAAATATDTSALEKTAAAASRRLDDTYRQYLAERGHEQLDMASVAVLVTGAARVRLAAYSVMSLGSEASSSKRGVALERESADLRAWFLSLAEAIRRLAAAPPPQRADGTAEAEVLRALDAAVADGDRDGIRAALGAALASYYIDSLRAFEPRLAGALDRLARDATRTPAEATAPA